MGAVIDMAAKKEWSERRARKGTRAQVWSPISDSYVPGFPDPCFGREGIIIRVARIEEGKHKDKFLYTIQFETPRGYIVQGYLEEELRFL